MRVSDGPGSQSHTRRTNTPLAKMSCWPQEPVPLSPTCAGYQGAMRLDEKAYPCPKQTKSLHGGSNEGDETSFSPNSFLLHTHSPAQVATSPLMGSPMERSYSLPVATQKEFDDHICIARQSGHECQGASRSQDYHFRTRACSCQARLLGMDENDKCLDTAIQIQCCWAQPWPGSYCSTTSFETDLDQSCGDPSVKDIEDVDIDIEEELLDQKSSAQTRKHLSWIPPAGSDRVSPGRVCTTPPPMLSKHYQDLGEWPSHRSKYVHPSVNEGRLLDHHLHVSTSQDGLYPSSKAASSHARTLFEATQKAYIPRIVSGLTGSRPVPVSTKCQSFFIHPKHIE